ncbi:MAG: sensor domain-containing diguanylate cyclase [Myxococcota bacterium]|nr:sensor domain-containing diguanylate cyclase [Myxococcota bacterium]
MSTFELTIYGIRRGWRLSRTFLFAGAFAAAFVGGVFHNGFVNPSNRTLSLLLFALWTVVFGIKAHQRFRPVKTSELAVNRRLDLELGLLLVVATHAVVQMAGGLDSPAYPMVFVLIAFLVVYMPEWVGFALVAAAISIELALFFFGAGQATLGQVLLHSVFIVFFALINLVFTRTEVARMQHRTKRQVEAAKEAMATDARDFRLTAPASVGKGTLSREEEEMRRSHASVSEVRRAMYHHINLLKRTMGLNTCVLLWLDTPGKTFRILECVSDSDRINPGPIKKGEGALGAIVQSGKPLRLKELKPGYQGLPFYAEDTRVTDFLGVPIIEGGSVRGVLCADRSGNRPFEAVETENLLASVESLLQIIANERIFTELQKSKSEQEKLLFASAQLARVLTEKDVVNAALSAALQIASYDIAAVALIDSDGHQIVRKAVGRRAEEIEGLRLNATSTLAAAAIKNRHYLPYRGELDPKQQIVFSKKTQRIFAKMTSAMVLPLVAGNEPLGTLTLASMTPSVYNEEVRTTLQVMTNQLATALQNARMVRRLEELATTDGLTGLSNHRVFQEELEKKLASATRFNKELSVILCDLDKFKSVNDTYGHPVGDFVLRALGDTLRKNVVRDTDLPARYGGEEFVVLCEGTSTEGAVKLAERIRIDLENRVFRTEQGNLQVTISMGVATFPIHALRREVLIERADAALYAAKQGGRNQVRIWTKGMAATDR